MNYQMLFSLMSLLLSAAAMICTVWNILENRREHKGMILYSDTAADGAEKKVLAFLNELKDKISNLESGITPDFEKAKAAAEAVNSFNMGISSILGYDPVEVLKASRNESRGDS